MVRNANKYSMETVTTHFIFIIGACMRRLNVTHGDSRDEKKIKRFFPFEIKDHIIPSECDIKSTIKENQNEIFRAWQKGLGL